MWAMTAYSSTITMLLMVVPSPASCGLLAAASIRSCAVATIVVRSASSACDGASKWWSRRFSRLMAMAEAMSPPAWPPMPSATTKRFEPA